MFRPNSLQLAGFLLLLIALLGGAALLKGGFYIGKHEGDTLHLVQMVLRLADGDMPHRDFVTPIGILALAPIALFSALGLGIGAAILWAQVLVAVLVAPALWWVAQTRLARGPALLLILFVMVLVLSLVHGEAAPSLSISMHYNRWAWALTFIVVIAALIPPERPGTRTIDGIVIGLAMAALVLIKVTYFVAFAPPILLGLLLTGQFRALFVAILAGLVVAAGVAGLLGPEFWFDYLGDLRAVANSDVRPRPGLELTAVVAAPLYIGASFAGLAGVIFLRQAGVDAGGLLLLALMPAFVYVTYQNFGNDPKWLMLLAVLLLAFKPPADGRNSFGMTHRAALGGTAAVALAMAAPSFFNMAYSPFRHYVVDAATYAPMLPRDAVNDDLRLAGLRAQRTDFRVPVDAPEQGLAAFRDEEKREDPIEFLGETRAFCALENGLVAINDAIARDLEEAGYSGSRLMTADLLSPWPLYGDFEPLQGEAPWYYGGLPGIADAQYVLVPTCPVSTGVQSRVLELLQERGPDDLEEVRRTPLYTLYSIGDRAGARPEDAFVPPSDTGEVSSPEDDEPAE